MPTPDDYNNQPGYRNFNPPPTTPGYFTVANPTGGPPLPGRTTESSTRNGNGTQVAQAPPPPAGSGVTPEQLGYKPGMTPEQLGFTPEEIAGARARGMIGANGLPTFPPGTVKFNSQGAAYNPARVGPPSSDPADPSLPGGTPSHPGEYKFPEPEPAAKPLPNLGAWTPDQAKPWLHVKPIAPQQVPDRPPDTHVGTRPAHIPRPGEAGYTTGPQQPGQPYTFGMFLGKALQHGFTGQAAYDMAAIGLAESQGYANRVHVNDGGKGFNSYGALQINGSNDAALIKAGFPGGARAALDVDTAFAEAYVLSKGGTDFSPWSTFNDKSYLRYLDGNARPEASSTLVVGPRQEYRPPPGREPGEWGAPVSHDWTPGNMPTAHDIPGILGALLPIAIAGVLGGGGLGMIAAYAGYQNARNKAQTEEAKQQKTLFQDRLKETEAGLKEELLEASGLWAQYGDDYTSPGAQQAWAKLAAKYGDTQLRAALESGGKGVEQLFKKRDEAFQTIGKVSAAQTKADEQAEQERKDQNTLAGEGFPVPPGGGGGGGGGGAPPGPEKPWENAPPGVPAPPPAAGGGPAAGTPPGGTPPAVPAAAPAPSEQPAAPEQPPPGPEAPAPAAPPGDTTLPDVRVTAPEPQPAAAPAPPPAAPKSVFDELVSEGVNGQDIEKFKAGVPKEGLPMLQAAIARKNAQIDAVQPGPNAAAQLAAIDQNFASYVNGVAHYTAQMPSPRANTGRDFTDRVQAAVKKINPGWNFANYKKQEEFAQSASGNNTQARLTRASTMGEAAANVMKDLKVLQDSGVEVTQDKISEAIDRLVNGLSGDPRYMSVANDILAFTQEDQALRTGNPSVTETEAQQTLVAGKVFLGSIESIRTYVTHNIDTANAAITHYQEQWKQMQGPGLMPGTDTEADAIIESMKCLDPKTGQYHMPNGTDLPVVLRAGVPETAPPPTVLPKPGTTAAPPPATGGGGGAPRIGPNGEGYDQVPKGGQYIGPDGKTYTKG